MKIWKRICCIAAACCMGLSLAACGRGGVKDDTEYTDEDTITYKWLIPTQQQSSVYNSKIIQELRERFNVDCEFSAYPTGEQFNNKKQLALTGEGEYDIYSWVTKDEANEYGADEMFVDLSEYTEYMPNIMKVAEENPNAKYNLYNGEGSIFRFPTVEKDPASSSLEFSVVDAQLEAAGKTLDDLKTWDGFHDTLVAMKGDKQNYYPFYLRTKALDVQNFLYPFIMSFTKGVTGYYSVTTPAFDHDTQTYKVPFEVSGYKEAIEFVQSLYTDGLINPNHVAVDNTGTIVESMKKGDTCITYDYNGGLSGTYTAQKDLSDAHEGWQIVPFSLPQTGEGKEVYGVRAMAFGENGTSLSSLMSDSKTLRAVKMLDWLYSEEAYDLLYWHEDVSAVDESGNHYYTNEDMYQSVASTVDVYLPWSITALFQSNYYTVLEPDNIFTTFREEVVLNEENDDKYVNPVALSFSFDEQEEISALQSKVNTYFMMNISGIMRGDSDSSWDEFVNELKDRGATRITEIYNQAYQRLYKTA